MIGAQPHGADAPSGGSVAVAELAYRVVEQAGEASLQIEAARLDLGQVVDDGALQVPFVADQVAGLPQQLAVAEGADGGGDGGPGGGGERCGLHDVNITLVFRYTFSTGPGPAMNRRAARAEPGAVQPKGTRELFGGKKGLERAVAGHLARAKPRQAPAARFLDFLGAGARAAMPCRQGSGITNREPRRGGGRQRLLRVVLLRDTVRCHSRLDAFGGPNLYPPVLMGRPPHEFLKTPYGLLWTRRMSRPEAHQDIKRLPAYRRSEVKNAIERYLRYTPTAVSKSRIKRLRGLRQPQYRLRVQDVRVYYDVEQATVHVLGVVEKSDTHRWLVEVSIPDEGSST